MADRLEWFNVTVGKGIVLPSLQVNSLHIPQGEVTEVRARIPPGPSGNVGFYIMAGGSQYIPRTVGSFIVDDNAIFTWPLVNAINSGDWKFAAYNTDIFDHTIQIGFLVNELQFTPLLTTSAPIGL